MQWVCCCSRQEQTGMSPGSLAVVPVFGLAIKRGRRILELMQSIASRHKIRPMNIHVNQHIGFNLISGVSFSNWSRTMYGSTRCECTFGMPDTLYFGGNKMMAFSLSKFKAASASDCISALWIIAFHTVPGWYNR